MYGKHFASMYEGSMIGAGAIPFAVMGYVIANFRLDRAIGAQVRLNATLLATILGESEQEVQKGIDFLCAPDPRSSSKAHEGRRLIKVGEFDYQVVNGSKYHAIRNDDERREQNRIAQERYRAKKKSQAQLTYESQERRFVQAVQEGDDRAANQVLQEPTKPPRAPAPAPLKPLPPTFS